MCYFKSRVKSPKSVIHARFFKHIRKFWKLSTVCTVCSGPPCGGANREFSIGEPKWKSTALASLVLFLNSIFIFWNPTWRNTSKHLETHRHPSQVSSWKSEIHEIETVDFGFRTFHLRLEIRHRHGLMIWAFLSHFTLQFSPAPFVKGVCLAWTKTGYSYLSLITSTSRMTRLHPSSCATASVSSALYLVRLFNLLTLKIETTAYA